MMQARIVFFLEPRFACEEWIHFHGDQSVIFLPAPLFNRVQLFNETEFCLFRADLPVIIGFNFLMKQNFVYLEQTFL